MDTISREKRSYVMSLVKGRDTKPEMLVRRIVSALGFRYRVYSKDLPGKPDIVFPRRKLVILVHGCFWHQHNGCPRAKLPKTRANYWSAKLGTNVVRDRRNIRALRTAGWKVLTIWECQLKKPDSVTAKIMRFLGNITSEKY
jgi:DNA mismatch endonuclease, patch repair protein